MLQRFNKMFVLFDSVNKIVTCLCSCMLDRFCTTSIWLMLPGFLNDCHILGDSCIYPLILKWNFIMMCWLFPGDGGWGQWSNWMECTKSCGGGVRSRKRECDSPSPEGEGSFCEGLGTEVIACNTDHCPGTFTKCVECRRNAWSTCTYWVLFTVQSVLYQCFDSVCVCVYSGTMLAGPWHSVQ